MSKLETTRIGETKNEIDIYDRIVTAILDGADVQRQGQRLANKYLAEFPNVEAIEEYDEQDLLLRKQAVIFISAYQTIRMQAFTSFQQSYNEGENMVGREGVNRGHIITQFLHSYLDAINIDKKRKDSILQPLASLPSDIDDIFGEMERKLIQFTAKGGKKTKSPNLLPQPTFYEARTGATAISDGRDLRDWKTIEGMIAMLHAPKDSIMQTRFEPCSLLLGWWGVPTGAQLEMLQSELQKLEFDALVTYFVCLSWAIEEYQVTTSLDSIIEAIGRGTDARRSSTKRQELRAKVWRWMLLFDSLAVIGARPGTWREPRDGDKPRKKIDPDKLYSRDALLKIIGTRATEQGTFDNSAPPKEITFVAGAWVNQWRGNREILSDFGNVRAIASIPRGKPSGAWAACIGFALHQKWREQAARAPVTRITKGDKKVLTQRFEPFTRRVLLAQLWRSDVDPEEILKSVNPERAKEYWDAAIEILKKDDIIGIYKEIKPLPTEREGWQDAWLDQPLDIRPKGESRKDAIEIYQSAEAARKRTRKKTTPKVT